MICIKQVTWPLDIVIDSFAVDYYNKIFRFLLQIKWALWQLEDLSFNGLLIVLLISFITS